MKKIILTCLAAAMFFNISSAQTTKTDLRETFLVGFRLGANYSNVYDSRNDGFNTDPKLGFVTGAFISIPIDKYLGIQPEILFSQKGFNSTGNVLGYSYDLKRTTSYIDIPLLFAFKPSEFFCLLAGPQYSYLLSQRSVFSNNGHPVLEESVYTNENSRKNSIGFTGGVDITMKHVVLGARIGWDVLDNNSDGSNSTLRYKNTWFQATVGYRLFKN